MSPSQDHFPVRPWGAAETDRNFLTVRHTSPFRLVYSLLKSMCPEGVVDLSAVLMAVPEPSTCHKYRCVFYTIRYNSLVYVLCIFRIEVP